MVARMDFKNVTCVLTDASVLSRAAALLPVFATPFAQYVIFPGFCDVHVHFREPGFSYKETMVTGSAAAARGGYTDVCTMPNLNPVPDSLTNLRQQLDLIPQSGVRIHPYGSITVGQRGETLAELAAMAPYCIAFSDDGRGVQSESLMRQAMLEAKRLGKLIVAHCEDNSLLRGGYIHDGAYAAAHGHRGICSESEWGPIARDLRLVKETGCAYHVCHISCKESVALIRAAKAEGIDVTCETAPHYLTMDDSCLQEDGRFKMNPPLRSAADRAALVEGLRDGTIDCIATDHAPHSAEEKAKGLEKSAFGVVGLETAFPAVYTHLVKTGLVPLETVIRALTENPRRRFGIPAGDSFTVWRLDESFTVDSGEFVSLGRATPYTGETLFGRCELTVADGRIVYKR
ncbi:MAG: dihydroorotase [Clostridia bacterium]|nr:dihydroorotase [Clostridia bacterium]